jgi:DNA-binding CsgD family transcriptional regulator
MTDLPAANTPPPERRAGLWRPFTPQQERVAELLAQGFAPRAVATTLGCTLTTVRVHIRQMAVLIPNPEQLPALTLVRCYVVDRRVRRERSA